MDSFAVRAVIVLIPMILCLTVHEYAHALVARWLGDRTAEEQGRITLNPLSHIDPIGTLLLPVLMVATTGGYFGWAKPVPYNPTRFDRRWNMRTGAMLVAAAGPASNFLFALLATFIYAGIVRFGFATELGEGFHVLLNRFIAVNVGLGIFNLLPVPPLDGSKVLAGLLPDGLSRTYEDLMAKGGTVAFLLVVLFAGRYLVVPIRGVLSLLSSLIVA